MILEKYLILSKYQVEVSAVAQVYLSKHATVYFLLTSFVFVIFLPVFGNTGQWKNFS